MAQKKLTNISKNANDKNSGPKKIPASQNSIWIRVFSIWVSGSEFLMVGHTNGYHTNLKSFKQVRLSYCEALSISYPLIKKLVFHGINMDSVFSK